MNFSSLNQNAYYTCHSSKVLKDWEGLPVEKETKIKDFFENISVLYLTPDLWDADFSWRKDFSTMYCLGSHMLNMEFMQIFIFYHMKQWNLVEFLLLMHLIF